MLHCTCSILHQVTHLMYMWLHFTCRTKKMHLEYNMWLTLHNFIVLEINSVSWLMVSKPMWDLPWVSDRVHACALHMCTIILIKTCIYMYRLCIKVYSSHIPVSCHRMKYSSFSRDDVAEYNIYQSTEIMTVCILCIRTIFCWIL